MAGILDTARFRAVVAQELALLLFVWVHDRPGSEGQSPPRVSLARAMRASVEWKPKARRMIKRSFPFVL